MIVLGGGVCVSVSFDCVIFLLHADICPHLAMLLGVKHCSICMVKFIFSMVIMWSVFVSSAVVLKTYDSLLIIIFCSVIFQKNKTVPFNITFFFFHTLLHIKKN